MEKNQLYEAELVVKLEEWLLIILVAMIPVINLVILLYFAFNSKVNPNKQNFAKAALIYLVVMFVLILATSWLL